MAKSLDFTMFRYSQHLRDHRFCWNWQMPKHILKSHLRDYVWYFCLQVHPLFFYLPPCVQNADLQSPHLNSSLESPSDFLGVQKLLLDLASSNTSIPTRDPYPI